jgi:hypothetical protein
MSLAAKPMLPALGMPHAAAYMLGAPIGAAASSHTFPAGCARPTLQNRSAALGSSSASPPSFTLQTRCSSSFSSSPAALRHRRCSSCRRRPLYCSVGHGVAAPPGGASRLLLERKLARLYVLLACLPSAGRADVRWSAGDSWEGRGGCRPQCCCFCCCWWGWSPAAPAPAAGANLPVVPAKSPLASASTSTSTSASANSDFRLL